MVTFLHHLIDEEGYYGRHGIGMFSIEPSCREHPGSRRRLGDVAAIPAPCWRLCISLQKASQPSLYQETFRQQAANRHVFRNISVVSMILKSWLTKHCMQNVLISIFQGLLCVNIHSLSHSWAVCLMMYFAQCCSQICYSWMYFFVSMFLSNCTWIWSCMYVVKSGWWTDYAGVEASHCMVRLNGKKVAYWLSKAQIECNASPDWPSLEEVKEAELPHVLWRTFLF